MRKDGFSLMITLLLVLLLTSLLLFSYFQIHMQWRMATAVESQLYSLVLAENGIEYARTVLPYLEIEPLLKGVDGAFSGTGTPEWRNPASLAQARTFDPKTWTPRSDDGLPFYDGRSLLPRGYAAEGGGYFFIRFTNNPEENPAEDQDFVVLVRSLGVVPARIRDPFLPAARNDLALVEARLRQERSFLLPSPLTLLGDAGSFQWEGESFVIDGTDRFGVSVISFSQPGLWEDLVGSLTPGQKERIQGQGGTPSMQDATLTYLESGSHKRLFDGRFWRRFESELPHFVDGPGGGLAWMDKGGTLDSPFQGVLAARGTLILTEKAQIEGLLLHLGGGELVMEDGAGVVGAVWMSNLDISGALPQSLPLSLNLRGQSRIVYSAAALKQALGSFPPTQLGWRILFPEMAQ